MGRVEYKDMIRFEYELVEKHRLFEGLELIPLATYEGMDTGLVRELKTPMATGFYKPYLVRGDSKVEKIVIGELHYMRRARLPPL